MQKLALFVLTLTAFSARADLLDYARPNGYDANIPNAEARAKDRDWKAFPKFDTIHIVEENTGRANPENAKVIQDQGIKADVAAGYYKSLQVRDLYIKDVKPEGTSVSIPFAVSVKHSFSNWGDKYKLSSIGSTINQGTIEVVGTLDVTISDKLVKVKVNAFNDSQALESFGRYAYANHGTDLEFARRIVVPTLETYFQNPENLARLIGQEVPQKL